jgi:hypothetical protein
MATIEATITKITQEIGSEWIEVQTDHPTVKKLTTKKEQVAREAAALRNDGVVALLTYTQRDRTVGDRTYKNYYLDAAAKAQTNGSIPGIDVVQPTGRKTDPEDAWRMSLAKGAELALRTLPLMPAEARDFDTQKTIAYAWARFITETPPPSADVGAAAEFASAAAGRSSSAPGTYDEPGSYDGPPPPSDDDIPF